MNRSELQRKKQRTKKGRGRGQRSDEASEEWRKCEGKSKDERNKGIDDVVGADEQ
jgi:hypothetical protein